MGLIQVAALTQTRPNDATLPPVTCRAPRLGLANPKAASTKNNLNFVETRAKKC